MHVPDRHAFNDYVKHGVELHEFLTAAVDGREFQVSFSEFQRMQHTVLGASQR